MLGLCSDMALKLSMHQSHQCPSPRWQLMKKLTTGQTSWKKYCGGLSYKWYICIQPPLQDFLVMEEEAGRLKEPESRNIRVKQYLLNTTELLQS
ncbi:mCG147722 [Mus musculus]|nr:mCG147722 [Mus musculus]